MPREEPFDIHVWKREQERKCGREEELRHTVLDAVCAALDELAEQFKWEEAYVFGSAVRPEAFSLRSDVDVAVSGMNKFRQYELVGALSSRVGRDVDVVLLEECPFADRVREQGLRWTKDSCARS